MARLAIALAASVLCSCASPPQAVLPVDHPLNSAYAHIQSIRAAIDEAQRRATERPTGRAVREALGSILGSSASKAPVAPALARPLVKQGAGYRELSASFSADTLTQHRVVSAADWFAGFRAACTQQAGILLDRFCSSADDHDKVLFMVTIRTQHYPNWNNATEHDVVLVEPTAQPLSPQYLQVLAASGFVTKAMLDARARASEAAAAERSARERARLALDWPRMQVRGQSVCRDEDGVRYTGFVEDFTDQQMKVSVTRAQFGATGLSPGNFRPSVTWTRPQGWFPC